MGQWQEKPFGFFCTLLVLKWTSNAYPHNTHTHQVTTTQLKENQQYKSFLLAMKEIMQVRKRRRVISVEIHSTTTFTTFCVKYLAYLLQALTRSNTSMKLLTNKYEEKNLDRKRKVRFEIDMAMVVSAGTHLKWTRTLKQQLGSGQWIPITSVTQMSEQRHNVPSSVNCMSVQIIRREKKISKLRESEMETGESNELSQCIDVLRELVPIGDEECSMNEWIDEVASYVTCLQFQVGVLRSLLSSSSD